MNFMNAADLATRKMVEDRRFAEVIRVDGAWRVRVHSCAPRKGSAWKNLWISVYEAHLRADDPSKTFWSLLDELAASGNKNAIIAHREIVEVESGESRVKDSFFTKVQTHNLSPHGARRDRSFQLEREKTTYTPDWNIISRRLRVEAKWKCTACRILLRNHPHLLHVHHCDFNRKNNAVENLRVVCAKCHSKYPGHGSILDSLSAQDRDILDSRPSAIRT